MAGLSGGGSGSNKSYSHVSSNGVGTVGTQGSDHQHAFVTDDNYQSTMKSTPFSVVPKYYALAYIMRIE